jgi:hypothetical protein
MKTLNGEYSMSIQDQFDSDFDMARSDEGEKKASEDFLNRFQAYLRKQNISEDKIKRVGVTWITFVKFDTGDPIYANAYYDFEVELPDDLDSLLDDFL